MLALVTGTKMNLDLARAALAAFSGIGGDAKIGKRDRVVGRPERLLTNLFVGIVLKVKRAFSLGSWLLSYL
jgi:hypothetical protein